MVTIQDLKDFSVFRNLTDQMLEGVLQIATLKQYEDKELIYRKRRNAENFYLLKRGKALLQVEISPDIIVSIASLKPGYCFGWSSLIRGQWHNHTAVINGPTDVIIISGEQMRSLMEKDHHFGYIFLLNVFDLVNDRLNLRTDQFLKSLSAYPELQAAMG
jgi:signal-transduction protein with cAMP-binding, CBS, and nucleotidyltransferase domain